MKLNITQDLSSVVILNMVCDEMIHHKLLNWKIGWNKHRYVVSDLVVME